MLTLKKFFLGAATLMLVETATVTPVQGFSLSFQSTDGTLAGNIVSPEGGVSTSLSLTGLGGSFSSSFVFPPGSWVGSGENQWFQRFGMVRILPAGSFLSNAHIASNMPPELPQILPIIGRVNSTLSILLLCHSEFDCARDSGAITINMSFTDSSTGQFYSWVGYSSAITVTAWNPTGTSIPITPTPPINSVPEPSPANALLLLGSGWLLWRKLGVLARGKRRDRTCV